MQPKRRMQLCCFFVLFPKLMLLKAYLGIQDLSDLCCIAVLRYLRFYSFDSL